MPSWIRFAVLLLAFGALWGCARREVKQYTIEEFLGTTNYSGASFSPDKTKILASSDATGVFNAYAVSVNGGEPQQLTRSTTDSIFAISYFPNDERFIYTADQGGNELNHIYVQDPDGTVMDLTPGEKLKAQFIGWARDDRSFYISSNERDNRFFDVYEVETDGYKRTLIYENRDGYFPGRVSDDKQYLTLVKQNVRDDSDIYLYDFTTKETKHLTPHEGEVSNSPQDFSPDGRWLYYTTNQDKEFAYLSRMDLSTGEREIVLDAGWDVGNVNFSRNGKYLVVSINNDAQTEVRILNATTGEQLELPELPNMNIDSVRISRDEAMIAFYASGSRAPGDLYFHSLSSGQTRRLTRGLNPAIDPRDLVDAEIVRFESYDGTVIPGLLYKPHGASEANKVPALVWVHGGPGGQTRVGYSGLIQYLVNHGYAVYGINNRGSSGYGKTFYKMDDLKHGDADLDDCVESKKMLTATGWVDPERIGIIGGSYGGYMVCAALAFRPDAFDVGVDIFGVTNWVRTLKSIPPWWEAQRKALYAELGDPNTQEDYLRKISPLFHASNIKKPMIVLQGANDPRVLKVESDEMVEEARKAGAPVEYIIFDDEGHGFRKKENQLRGYEAVLVFLDKYLKGEGDSASSG